jgi:hypothetical protein
LKSAYVAMIQHTSKIGIEREEVKHLNGVATERPVAEFPVCLTSLASMASLAGHDEDHKSP